MLDFTLWQLAVGLILVVGVIEWWRLRHAGPRLVLRAFRVRPDDPGEFLYILGRRSGLIAWFLTLFGLESQTSFSATNDEVARDMAGPSGFHTLYAPLVEVTASSCAYYRAFSFLVLSLALYLYGLLTLILAMLKTDDRMRQAALAGASYTLLACLILGSLCYLWYALSKRVLLSVIAKGVPLGISFKRSVIENTRVELNEAIAAVDLLNTRILAQKTAN